MQSIAQKIEEKYKKHAVVDVQTGDTVRVSQKIREGNKERVQIFEGLVIRATRKNSHTASITVRRIASGVGVEKTLLAVVETVREMNRQIARALRHLRPIVPVGRDGETIVGDGERRVGERRLLEFVCRVDVLPDSERAFASQIRLERDD